MKFPLCRVPCAYSLSVYRDRKKGQRERERDNDANARERESRDIRRKFISHRTLRDNSSERHLIVGANRKDATKSIPRFVAVGFRVPCFFLKQWRHGRYFVSIARYLRKEGAINWLTLLREPNRPSRPEIFLFALFVPVFRSNFSKSTEISSLPLN